MELKINLELNQEEKNELCYVLGCNVADLQKELTPYCRASVLEYLSMILGKKVFKRGSDINEYRLSLLIENVFKNRIPNEQDVCKLFQTTTTESRSLIRAVMSKYQYQLKTAIDSTLKELIDNMYYNQIAEKFVVEIKNKNLVEELNKSISEIDGTLPPVKLKTGSVSTYSIENSSYTKLCKKFSVTPKKVD